ncbi:MAG: CoA-transferase [Spirochaetota bacterium]|nr:CoA-transferase [Spirochaetota bacterium]HPI13810.1 CoA-transferase [Spirochaetota bacterium]HPV97751.1 CoA-transferase [Spirochaetota bacterium]
MSKVMSTSEAVQRFVNDGDFLFIGGYICRPPFAAVHEIIRQKKRGLTITRSNAADDFDMLIGAGCVKRFIATFISLGLYGLARCYRRSLEKGIPHKIELEEYTNLSLPLMLMAGAMGMPFVPVKDMVGTDLMKVKAFMGENKYKMMDSPFDGSPVMLAPALNPDTAIIHVQQADEDGNAQMWGIGGDCKWGANAAKKVIVSCERIVSRETIGKDPSRTIVPAFKVAAVTEEPFGAHPGYTPGFYDVDFSFGYTYQQASNTVEGFQAFLDEWVFGVKDRAEYTQKYIQTFGYPQYKKLQAKFDYGYPVSYAY